MTQSAAPGWYSDGQGGQRWWDGNQWTEHTQQPGPAEATQVRPPDGAPGAPGQYGAPQQGGYGQPGHPGAPQHVGYPGQPGRPGQPAWQGQHLGGGSSGGGNGKLIGIIVGALAAVVVLLVVLFLVLGGGSPKDVAADYLNAVQDRDCDFIELLDNESREVADRDACEDDPDQFFGGDDECPDAEFDLTNEEVDGDKATVDYVVTGDEECEGNNGTVTLVKEGGDWKVDRIYFSSR